MGGGKLLLTAEEAAELLGVGSTVFHELRRESWFPKAIALGARVVRWSRKELEEAVDAMPRQQAPAEPLQLAKGRAARSGRTEVTA